MKRKIIVTARGLILSISLFIGCQSLTSTDSSQINDIQSVNPAFVEAVQEIYEMTGKTLFYSSNGRTMDRGSVNRATGTDEIPGVCTDYAIEFAYYWNEVKNYDEVFGKAYLARIPSNSSVFEIQDFRFAPNGTSRIRQESGNFGINGNDYENDGVYRDIIITRVVLRRSRIRHFGGNTSNHKWVVINIDGDWYDCEPTWWDYGSGDFVPYKLNL